MVSGIGVTAAVAVTRRGGGGGGGSVVSKRCGAVGGRVVGAVVGSPYSVGGRGRGGGRGAASKLITVLPVQPVQSVQRVKDLLLGHPRATQALQQIYLLNSEAWLLAQLRHPAAEQHNTVRGREEKRKQDMQDGSYGEEVEGKQEKWDKGARRKKEGERQK